jgi:hypothetical protein
MDGVLRRDHRDQFVQNGFLRIDNAFSRDMAEAARKVLWREMDLDPQNPATWTQPVIRLGMYSERPFVDAANTSILHARFDELVGRDKWFPCKSMGTFPVRFPSTNDAGDTGWHVDAGFPGSNPSNYFEWRINSKSKGRALLMLFLFSDVGEADAPTRIRVGSHLDVARLLKSSGEEGMSFMELAQKLDDLPARNEILATGEAGTVYLCHPFLVHAAQQHRGTQPRFLAQPPLVPREEFILERADGKYTPLEESLRLGLQL